MMAGFVAVLDQEIGQRLGNMNNIYYNLAAQQYGVQGIANGFHDITNGNNSFGGVNGFNAGPAYDQATGLGSIDFDVFAAVVKDHTPITADRPPDVRENGFVPRAQGRHRARQREGHQADQSGEK